MVEIPELFNDAARAMHEGKIWAESRYEEGSIFTFTLPLNAKGGK